MTRIVVDTAQLRDRAAMLRVMRNEVRGLRLPPTPEGIGGSGLVDASLHALMTTVRDALPAVAAELTTVASIVELSVRAYDVTERSIGHG